MKAIMIFNGENDSAIREFINRFNEIGLIDCFIDCDHLLQINYWYNNEIHQITMDLWDAIIYNPELITDRFFELQKDNFDNE